MSEDPTMNRMFERHSNQNEGEYQNLFSFVKSFNTGYKKGSSLCNDSLVFGCGGFFKDEEHNIENKELSMWSDETTQVKNESKSIYLDLIENKGSLDNNSNYGYIKPPESNPEIGDLSQFKLDLKNHVLTYNLKNDYKIGSEHLILLKQNDYTLAEIKTIFPDFEDLSSLFSQNTNLFNGSWSIGQLSYIYDKPIEEIIDTCKIPFNTLFQLGLTIDQMSSLDSLKGIFLLKKGFNFGSLYALRLNPEELSKKFLLDKVVLQNLDLKNIHYKILQQLCDWNRNSLIEYFNFTEKDCDNAFGKQTYNYF